MGEKNTYIFVDYCVDVLVDRVRARLVLGAPTSGRYRTPIGTEAAAVSVDESGRRVFKLIPSGAVKKKKKKRTVPTCRVGGDDGDVGSG